MIEKKIGNLHFTAGTWPPEPGKETIIFIHGSGNSSALWDGQVTALREQVNTAAIDLPGHGKSPGPGKSRVEDYAVVVEDCISGLGIQSPIFCGLSLGGAITLQILLNRNISAPGAVLVNTGARLRVHPEIFKLLDTNFTGYVKSLHLTAASDQTPKSMLEPVIESARKCGPDVTRGDFTACDSFDVMERLNEVTVPVLVLSAEQDKLTPPKYGEYLANRLSGAEHVHITGAGHLSPVEKPDEFNAAVTAFLDTLRNKGKMKE